MSETPLVTPGRDALAKALCRLDDEDAPGPTCAQHQAEADALLASGVVVTPDVYPLTVAVTQVLGAVDSVLARGDYTVESDVIPTWLHCKLDNLRALAASQNALADAWQTGYLRGTLDNESDLEPADNPYRDQQVQP